MTFVKTYKICKNVVPGCNVLNFFGYWVSQEEIERKNRFSAYCVCTTWKMLHFQMMLSPFSLAHRKTVELWWCCFGECGFVSGSGSKWIRIELAPLDPDPYWDYWSGFGWRAVKMTARREKVRDFKWKINQVDEGLMVFHLSLERP